MSGADIINGPPGQNTNRQQRPSSSMSSPPPARSAQNRKLSPQNTCSSRKSLTILSANVFGLCSKFGEFQNVLRTSHADIAVITETKLTQEKMSLTESASGFHAPLRLDRTGQGGGVAVWIKEDLAYEHLSAIDCGPHEIIWLSIKLKSKEKTGDWCSLPPWLSLRTRCLSS